MKNEFGVDLSEEYKTLLYRVMELEEENKSLRKVIRTLIEFIKEDEEDE